MTNYNQSIKNLPEKMVEEFTKSYNRLELLYDWIQQGKINKEQFPELIELHKKREKRQFDLDSFD